VLRCLQARRFPREEALLEQDLPELLGLALAITMESYVLSQVAYPSAVSEPS
jgi:hypothetical protein